MTQDELIHQLGALLLSDPEVTTGEWQHVALVGVIEASETHITGFCYGRDGQVDSAAPRLFETIDVLQELRRVMAANSSTAPWRACLIRLERATNTITVEFEYDDPSRWLITFANRTQRAHELRPPGLA